jgi:FMN phosphatase YigB (HAD superfamily)
MAVAPPYAGPVRPPLDAVLFDFHGTLMQVEDERSWVRGAAAEIGLTLGDPEVAELAAALVRAGRAGGPHPGHVPAELAELYATRDLSAELHRAAYTGLLRTVDLPHEDLADALYDRGSRPDCWVPYADAAGVLAELRDRGVRTALVSNIGFDVRPILARHGLVLDELVLSYEVGIQKPDARIFTHACALLGTEPARAVMVGDHLADGGAVLAGLRSLLLPTSPPGAVHGLGAVRQLL